ncbi:SgrR family transcriptional regulator [Halobacillus trueperi]|uniref:Transcriptional regulator SgrR N-terminal HTH domain-containing protein n=1 Tax=Halobacillus trueperi TaxID=156205 RepID=A0A3E0JAF2_9BACI|nr:SgrR family transcriptional regulator [Halobacillus trueperi]REJ09892.1 hypothetical protein DYE48_07220 [Halobacillus trueperi]
MKLEETYIRLRTHFHNVGEEEQVDVTMQQLADDLFYTLRNLRIIIKKMEEAGWLTWIPGRGRGNRSSIIFHLTKEEAQLQFFKSMIFDGRENEAFIRVETEAPSIMLELTDWYYHSKFIVYYDPAIQRQFINIRELITKENVAIYCSAIKESLEHATEGFTILIDMNGEKINTPDVEGEMEELRSLVVSKKPSAIALYTHAEYMYPYLKQRMDEMGHNKIFPTKKEAEAYLDAF